jgi:dephospho-CoA kinase
VKPVKDKILIGITGVIASGKSLVTNYLKDLGYYTISADVVNRELLLKEVHIRKVNALLFNINSDILDKKEVRRLIFNDSDARLKLEGYLHPLIKLKIFELIKKSKEKVIFVEVPLLFEANYLFFDKIITVYSPNNVILERLMIRDNIKKEEAKKLINSQIDIDKKVSLSDYVIDNTKGVENTKKEVLKILEEMEKEYGNL